MIQFQNDTNFDKLELVQRVVDPVRCPIDNEGAYIAIVGHSIDPEDEAQDVHILDISV